MAQVRRPLPPRKLSDANQIRNPRVSLSDWQSEKVVTNLRLVRMQGKESGKYKFNFSEVPMALPAFLM